MTSSPCMRGPLVTVPSIRPLATPPAGLPALPTVVEPDGPVVPELDPDDGDPEELAVPAAFVPGAVLVEDEPWFVRFGSLIVLNAPLTLSGPGRVTLFGAV